MANTFLAANGVDTKRSMIENDLIKTAADIMAHAKAKGIDLLLPVDLVVADRFDKDAQSRTVSLDDIPDVLDGCLDIGPETAQHFANAIADAGTIVWNGPMGVFEMAPFAGTQTIADAIARSSAFSVVGGGDTGLAAKQCGISERSVISPRAAALFYT